MWAFFCRRPFKANEKASKNVGGILAHFSGELIRVKDTFVSFVRLALGGLKTSSIFAPVDQSFFIEISTDVQISIHTLLVKYYNDLLGRQRQSSERGRDEVGDLFCIHYTLRLPIFKKLYV